MDTAALLRENTELKSRNKDLEAANSKLSTLTETLHIQVIKLQEQVDRLQLLHFGPKSEKMTAEDKRTQSLFNEAEDTAFRQNDENEIKKVTESVEVKAHTKKVSRGYGGRVALDKGLPREVKEYDLDDNQKICCQTEMKCIGEDISERLKVYPPKVVVLQERKKKYVCEICEGTEREDEKGVVTAQGPKHLIAGSIADESFLAWSITEKFVFALPFYRQSIRLSQIGAPISRATLSNLAVAAGKKCGPLYDLLKESILSGAVINADETPVQVLKEPGRRDQTKSWMWVFLGGPPDKKSVVFHYATGRGHEIPYDFLKEYSGWLQTDDYEAYHTALKKIKTDYDDRTINHVLCWFHARSGFHQYWDKTGDGKVKQILDLIGELFNLEKLRKDFTQKEFMKQRKARAAPIFSELNKRLLELYPKVPPGLALGKAISYTLDNWDQLITYVDHVELTPSNNAAERAIRPFVIGRKNWLFSGSPAGAKSSAILYSLVESAKMNNLVPIAYLYFIFRKLPYCLTKEDYRALLPFNVDPIQLKEEGQ